MKYILLGIIILLVSGCSSKYEKNVAEIRDLKRELYIEKRMNKQAKMIEDLSNEIEEQRWEVY